MQGIKYIFATIVLALTTTAIAQSSLEEASEAYRTEDYKKSIQLYEQVVAQGIYEGKESGELYYNLGNAYFRNGEVAKAILRHVRNTTQMVSYLQPSRCREFIILMKTQLPT